MSRSPADTLQLSDEFRARFQLGTELGRGGMGVVFKATQTDLERPVAIKFLREDYASHDPAALQRFVDEGRICSSLSHPNVVHLYATGRDSVLYLVYEFIEGSSLEDVLAAAPGHRLGLGHGLSVAVQICRGLGHAHEQGVVHRDVKPANVLIETATGSAKVTDFGIARNPLTGARTKTGIVVGTPSYMAPEQGRGEKDLDARTDVYALGAMFYEVFTGRPPYPGGGIEVVRQHVSPTVRPVPLTQVNPDVPAAVGSIIQRALDKDRSLRWRDGTEFAEALERVARDLEAGRLGGGPGDLKTIKGSVDAVADAAPTGPAAATIATDTGGRKPSTRTSLRRSVAVPPKSSTVAGQGFVRRRRYSIMVSCAALFVCAAVWVWSSGGPIGLTALQIVVGSNVVEITAVADAECVVTAAPIRGFVGWRLAPVRPSADGIRHGIKGTFEGLTGARALIEVSCRNGRRYRLALPKPVLVAVPVDHPGGPGVRWRFFEQASLQIDNGRPTVWSIDLEPSSARGSTHFTSVSSRNIERLDVIIEYRAVDCAWAEATKAAAEVTALVDQLGLHQRLEDLFGQGIREVPSDVHAVASAKAVLSVETAEWKRLSEWLETFRRDDDKRVALASFLAAPFVGESTRLGCYDDVVALRLATNALASTSLLDERSELWTVPPTTKGAKGFWVPNMGFDSIERSVAAVERSTGPMSPTSGTLIAHRPRPPHDRDMLVLPKNVVRDGAVAWGPPFLDGSIPWARYSLMQNVVEGMTFRDLKETFVESLPVSVELPLRGHIRAEGRLLRICLTTWFLDVACAVRVHIGRRTVYLTTNECTDLHDYVVGGAKFGSACKLHTVDFACSALEEPAVTWTIECPSDWLNPDIRAITVDCVWLTVPLRIGSNVRETFEVRDGVVEPLRFVNVVAIGDVTCRLVE